jgi:hypothetical protein
MPSKKLENFSRRNPELAPLVQKLMDYIHWLSDQKITKLIPRVAAALLGISEADTLGLLSLFQDAGIVEPRYDLVCKRTGSLLGSYHSLDEIPDKIECNVCGKEHDADDLRVDLVFEIAQGRAANAAA